MKSVKINIVFYLLCSYILFFSSCSTKKKTWAHKQYHNTTAKYNGYYNSNKSIKDGIKKLQEGHKDDYTKILQIYKTGDLLKNKSTHGNMDKAIKKSSIVIQRHSINIRGKEYCKWIDENYLLVGVAYFYKGDFEEAIKTFQFIKNEYNVLKAELDKNIKTDENLKNFFKSLKEINSKLWVIEDDKRMCEKNKDFGEKFIKLSRDVHFLNDERAKIKLEINNHTGSKIKEIKEYTSY